MAEGGGRDMTSPSIEITPLDGTGFHAGDLVSFAHSFPQSHVWKQKIGIAGIEPLQELHVLRRWPDTSIKHALFVFELPDGIVEVPLRPHLVPGDTMRPLPASTGLGLVDDVDFDVLVEIDDFDPVSLRKAWTGPHRMWLKGDAVQERVLFVPLPHGLSLQAAIRKNAGTGIVLDFAFENNMPSAQDRVYDVDITIYGRHGGHSIFRRSQIVHWRWTRWRWRRSLGKQKRQYHVAYDPVALAESGAILPFTKGINVPVWRPYLLYDHWHDAPRELLQPGLVVPDMGRTGGRDDIGPIPAWGALDLLTGKPEMREVSLDCGTRAGVFPVHVNDESGSVLRIDDPTHLGFVASGKTLCPNYPDSAHHPSLAYLPYLMTGDAFYHDELAHWANWLMLSRHVSERGGTKGLVIPQQIRGEAWALRTLGQAAWILREDV